MSKEYFVLLIFTSSWYLVFWPSVLLLYCCVIVFLFILDSRLRHLKSVNGLKEGSEKGLKIIFKIYVFCIKSFLIIFFLFPLLISILAYKNSCYMEHWLGIATANAERQCSLKLLVMRFFNPHEIVTNQNHFFIFICIIYFIAK